MGSWGEAGGEGEQWLVCKVNKTFKIKNRNILYSKNFFSVSTKYNQILCEQYRLIILL